MVRGIAKQPEVNGAAVYARGSGEVADRQRAAGTVEQSSESVRSFHMNRLLRRKEVEQMVGLSRASIYRLADIGVFPHPVRVGPRAVRWRLGDIERWIAERPAASGDGGKS